MVIRQLSVFLENRVGTLNNITETLAEQGIDIRAITLADTVEFGILRLIVSDPDRAERVLRENNFVVSITEVLGVHLSDIPGGLNTVLRILQSEGISIEYVYAFVSKSEDACVIFYAKERQRAEDILRQNGVRLVDEAY